jgi:hypothetical protein
MIDSLTTRLTEVYVALALFFLMVLAMLWAGVASVKQARILKLRWVGYGNGIGWLAISALSFAILVASVYSLIVHGLPENFQHINLISWVWILVYLLFSLWVAITMEMSVRNLRHMTKEAREQFAHTKRAMQQLRHKVGDG